MLEWQRELLDSIELSRSGLSGLPLTDAERSAALSEQRRFPALVPRRYSELIAWEDAADPLRKLLLPAGEEALEAGRLDTSGESESVVARGIQHKYERSAVILLTQACAGHCRYCFRRRLMTRDIFSQESIQDLDEAVAYLARHPGIDNVLLSGGDPLLASTRRIERLLDALAPLAHVRTVRFSTKLPAFLPSRFTSDPDLLALFSARSARFRFLFQCHFDHPRELTRESRASLDALRATGSALASQVALMRGINDEPATLAALFRELHDAGVMPQYLFHPRPVKHATHFQLPILAGLATVEAARDGLAGPEKRFRYILANEEGKLELVGSVATAEGRRVVVRWHQVRRGLDKPERTELRAIGEHDAWL